MFRLLIVDDEPGIVDGLYQLFRQNENFELDIYKAYSGEEALSYLKSTRVDIVLTDICMPGLDGMKLLDEISSHWPSCKVIFLTGYDEFEYAYKAIKTDVGYVLKTEEDEVIFEAVKKAIMKIEEEIKFQDIAKRADKQFKQAMPMLRREFLTGLLQGDRICEEQLAATFEELEISMDPNQPVFMVVAKIGSWNYKNTYSEKMQKFYMMQNIFDNYMNSIVSSISVNLEDSMLVWFIQPNSQAPENGSGNENNWFKAVKTFVKGNIELIQNSIKNILHVCTNFAIADEPVRWEDAYEKFCVLKTLINSSVMKNQQMLIIDESVEEFNTRQKIGSCSENRILIDRQLGRLRTFLENGMEDEFHIALDKIMKDMEHYRPGSLMGIEFYHTLSSMFVSYINRTSLDSYILSDKSVHVLMELTSEKTWEEIAGFFKKFSELIFQSKKMKEDDGVISITERIHKYINQNIGKDISMAKLSEIVHFNPSYLSRFYKQATGRTLSDYINEVKIKTAKELLSDSTLKINEIGERIGFESPSYFSFFFKKQVGMTPQEFRDSLSSL